METKNVETILRKKKLHFVVTFDRSENKSSFSNTNKKSLHLLYIFNHNIFYSSHLKAFKREWILPQSIITLELMWEQEVQGQV